MRRHTTSVVSSAPIAATAQLVGSSSQQSVTILPGFPSDHMVSFAMGDVPEWDQLWAGLCEHLQSLVDSVYRHDLDSIEDLVSPLPLVPSLSKWSNLYTSADNTGPPTTLLPSCCGSVRCCLCWSLQHWQ